MHYFEVAVESKGLRGHDSLTYSYSEIIPTGSIVRVPLRNKPINGVVVSETKKPSYPTKDISKIVLPAALNSNQLKLARWIKDYYATDLAKVIQIFIPRGAQKKRRDSKKDENQAQRKNYNHNLTSQQKDALKQLKKNKSTALLHGVTGSGKTRVYIELTKKCVDGGQGAIILVPEIGLTPQIVADFEQSFEDVFVLHSQQSESLRHQQWMGILESKSPVVIGPRSALFSPVAKLGLIVVDEEHETSYKQDQSPKYHAVRVASQLAHISGAKLVLGSATPRVEDYYLAELNSAQIIEMDKQASGDKHITTSEIIDLRDKQQFTKSRVLSNKLISAIEEALAKNKQILLFHNRRGSSTSVICANCGWLAECPNCFLPLTHHRDWQKLVCHVCNHREHIRTSCPDCGLAELNYKGIGTKQIAHEVSKLFPAAKLARFDGDNYKEERLHERYQELYDGRVDIIIGTQMIAKGIDLPKLAVVGVVVADTALHIPDYSANERAFQLLHQVIGRAGRHQDGRAFIQSYTPEHIALRAAVERDYKQFYSHEIEQRKLTSYPPFSHLLLLSCERASSESARNAAIKVAAGIRRSGVKVLGPSPAFHERNRGKYRWQIVIKAKTRNDLIDIVASLPANWQHDIDPINLL